MPEVRDIVGRCKKCGMATEFAVLERDLDDDGQRRLRVWTERLEHKRDECERFATLEREQWPTLW